MIQFHSFVFIWQFRTQVIQWQKASCRKGNLDLSMTWAWRELLISAAPKPPLCKGRLWCNRYPCTRVWLSAWKYNNQGEAKASPWLLCKNKTGLERAVPARTLAQKLRAGEQFLARGRVHSLLSHPVRMLIADYFYPVKNPTENLSSAP